MAPVLIGLPLRPSRKTGWAVIDAPERLDALRCPWDALPSGRGRPDARHAWASAWARDLPGDTALHVVIVLRDGRLAAVAPLALRADGVLEPLGSAHAERPAAFAHADGEALHALAQAVARSGATLHAPRLVAGGPAVAALAGACANGGLFACHADDRAAALALSNAWTAPGGALVAPWREALRDCRARAQEVAAVTIDVLSPAVHDLDPLLDEALAVAGRDRAAGALPRAVLRGYAREAAAAGALRLGVLRLGWRPVAMRVAVEEGDALWLVERAMDPRFAGLAPDALLLVELLRDAAARGLRSCVALGRSEPWLEAWGGEEGPRVALRCHPAQRRGLVRLGGDACRSARRALLEGTR